MSSGRPETCAVVSVGRLGKDRRLHLPSAAADFGQVLYVALARPDAVDLSPDAECTLPVPPVQVDARGRIWLPPGIARLFDRTGSVVMIAVDQQHRVIHLRSASTSAITRIVGSVPTGPQTTR